jgi:hypothetical protein
MITTAELHRAAAREGLRFDQAEKYYMLRMAPEYDLVWTEWTVKCEELL